MRGRTGRWCRAAWLGAAMIGVAGGLASAQNLAPIGGVDLPTRVNELLSLRQHELVTLNIDLTLERPVRVVVPSARGNFTLDLVPNSVRAPGYQVLEQVADGSYREAKAGPENTLKGVVLEAPGSEAAGGILEDGLYVSFYMPDGTRYWLEPVSARLPGAPANRYAFYSAEDVIPGGGKCGVDDWRHVVGHGQAHAGGYTPRGGGKAVADVATDADFEFYARYGSTFGVNSRISLIVNTLNLQYGRDVDILHQITTQIVRTAEPDPYTATASGTLLDQLRNHWNANHGGVVRDTVHLFTGKDVDGGIIGIAYIGVVCSNFAFSYGLSQAGFDGSFASDTDLVAHELGHNWNADHCTCSNPAFTMNPFITAANRFGGPTGVNGLTDIAAITGQRNAAGGCLGAAGGEIAPNNACANAPQITAGTWGFNNVGATTDGPAACASAGADIWYRYVAPCNGLVSINTCNSDFDTVLAAYTGGCGALAEVACNDDTVGCGIFDIRGSSISFATQQGATYWIRVAGYFSSIGTGILNVSESACVPPSNDTCGGATPISHDVAYNFSNALATSDGPLEQGCTFFSESQFLKDIWYRVVAPCTGTYRVSTCGSGFDTKVAVYSGCPSGINQAIACNDDNGPACTGTRSSVDFVGTGGVAYYIRIGGYNGASGGGTLTVSSLSCPRPANDDCANASVVGPAGGSVLQSFAGATNDGSASCGATLTARDVWFSYTATCDGVLTATTCGSHDLGGVNAGIDTVLSIHTGCPGNVGNQIACLDDSLGCGSLDASPFRDSVVSATLSAGQTVLVRLANFGSGTPVNQQVYANFSFSPLNSGGLNDSCAGAVAVTDGATPYCTIGATTDGPGDCGAGSDVWYVYTASCTGTVQVDTCNSNYDTYLAVYDFVGCPPSGLLACNDDVFGCGIGGIRGSVVTFAATAGDTYMIRVGGFASLQGSGVLNIVNSTPCGCDSVDFDCDGDSGTDADIEAFFACLGGSCPPSPCTSDSDFDNDGDAGTDADIEAFFLVLGGGTC